MDKEDFESLLEQLKELLGAAADGALEDIEERTGFKFISNDTMKNGYAKEFSENSVRFFDETEDDSYAQSARRGVIAKIISRKLDGNFVMNPDSCILFNKETGEILVEVIPLKQDETGHVASSTYDFEDGELVYEDEYSLKTHGAIMRATYPLAKLYKQKDETAETIWYLMHDETEFDFGWYKTSYYKEDVEKRAAMTMNDIYAKMTEGAKE